MERARVLEGETADALSARLGRPICMILRANRLYSVAWLMPGREIAVPELSFCRADGFCCPAYALTRCPADAGERLRYMVGSGDCVRDIASALGVPERLVHLAAGRSGGELPAGTPLALPVIRAGEIVHVGHTDTMRSICEAHGADEASVRSLNKLWGPLLPGMRLLIGKDI